MHMDIYTKTGPPTHTHTHTHTHAHTHMLRGNFDDATHHLDLLPFGHLM